MTIDASPMHMLTSISEDEILRTLIQFFKYIYLIFLQVKQAVVSLFNGMLNFVGYLMPNSSLLKDNSDTIKSIAGGIRGSIPFPKVFPRKWM